MSGSPNVAYKNDATAVSSVWLKHFLRFEFVVFALRISCSVPLTLTARSVTYCRSYVNTTTHTHTSYWSVFHSWSSFSPNGKTWSIKILEMWKRKTTNKWLIYLFNFFGLTPCVTALIYDKCCPFRFNTWVLWIENDARFRSLVETFCICAVCMYLCVHSLFISTIQCTFHSRLFTKGR